MEYTWICPICGSREIGRISRERYFCGECCNEWTIEGGEITIYQIAVDGSVIRLRNRMRETIYPKQNVS